MASQGRQSNQHAFKGYSQLAAIRIDNMNDSLEVSIFIVSYCNHFILY